MKIHAEKISWNHEFEKKEKREISRIKKGWIGDRIGDKFTSVSIIQASIA